jgi:putative colanic acid biosynthesis glycosyltransferase
MNKGIERSSGEYLLFLNAGDFLHDRDVLAQVVQKQQGEDWLIGDVVDLLGGGVRIYKKTRTLAYLRHSLPSSHQAIFFHRDAIGDIRYRGDQFSVSGDYAFAAEIYQSGRRSVCYLGIPVCVFRLGGISTQSRAGVLRDAWMVQKRILEKVLPYRLASYVYRFVSMFLLDNYSRLYQFLRTWADRFSKASE